jgi:O-antigen/teichoic acid export membrane protein
MPLKRLALFMMIYGASELANYVLGFLLVPVYTRLLTPSQYGVLEIFNRTVDVLGIFTAVGIGMAVMRSYFGKEKGEGEERVFSTAMVFSVTNALWIAVVLSLVAGRISRLLLGSNEYATLFRVAFTILIFEQGFGLVTTYLRATARPITFSVLNVSKYAVTLGLILASLLYLGREVKYVLFATLAASVIFFVPSGLAILSRIGLSISWPVLKRMIAFGLPFVPGGVLLFILNSSDRFLLIAMVGQKEAGLYALGYRIAVIPIMLLMGPFQAAWGPFMMEKGESPEGPRLFATVLSYLIAAYCGVSLLLALFAKEVIHLIAGPSFVTSYKIIPIVLLAYSFWVVSVILDAGIYITRRTVFKPLLLAAGAGTNVGLNLLLIPKLGMMGAAYATAAGFLVFVLVTYIVSMRFFPVPYEIGRISLCIGGAVLLFCVYVLVSLEGIAGVLFRVALVACYVGILRLAGFTIRSELELIREWKSKFRGVIEKYGKTSSSRNP